MSEADYRKIFMTQLRYYMNLHQKTQTDLMKDLNIGSSTISSWCTGKKLPRMDKIQMLADYFGIKKSDLIENPNDKETDELQEYLEVLKNRPEMRMLFQISKDATKEDVEKAVAIIEALRK